MRAAALLLLLAACGSAKPAAPLVEPLSSQAPATERDEWIAFGELVPDRGDFALRLMPAAGGVAVASDPPIDDLVAADFADDGSLFVLRARGDGELWRVALDGGTWRARALGSSVGPELFAADHRVLHACAGDRDDSAICVTDRDGTRIRVSSSPSLMDPLGWSTDRTRVFWIAEGDRDGTVRSAALDGGEVRDHATVPHSDTHVHLARTGTALVWANTSGRAPWVAFLLIAADAERPLDLAGFAVHDCALSNAGDVVVCVVGALADRSTQLRLYDRDGGATTLATVRDAAWDEATEGYPVLVFSPDDRTILFRAYDQAGVEQLHLLPRAGGELRVLGDGPGDKFPLAWR